MKKFIKKDGGSIAIRNHNDGGEVHIPVAQQYREELLRRAESLRVL